MNPRVRVAILALAVFAGAACSSGKDKSADSLTTTTTTPEQSATTTTPASVGDDKEAVRNAYLQFWAVVDDYGKRTGRFDPTEAKTVLSAVATDGEYEHLFDMLQLNRLKGHVYRDGDAPDEFAPIVTIEGPARASIRDCRTDRGGVFNASTGERVDTPTEGRRLFEVVLVKEDSQWKVSSVGGRTNPEDPPCTV